MTTAPAAAVVVVRAMLQSPQFLYRLESQTPPAAGAVARPLDNYELATRLVVLLLELDARPTLLAAAKAGTLTTPDGLQAQVTRLLTGPHARDMIQRYFREWLSLDDLDDANRGAAFTPQLAADMKQETLDDVADQLWDAAQPMKAMFTTKTTKVTPALAKYYGLGAPDAAGRYATDALPGRGRACSRTRACSRSTATPTRRSCCAASTSAEVLCAGRAGAAARRDVGHARARHGERTAEVRRAPHARALQDLPRAVRSAGLRLRAVRFDGRACRPRTRTGTPCARTAGSPTAGGTNAPLHGRHRLHDGARGRPARQRLLRDARRRSSPGAARWTPPTRACSRTCAPA